MQKFEFKAFVYAKTEEAAKQSMRDMLGTQAIVHGDMLNALEFRQVSRKPPYEKKNTVYYTVRMDGKGPRLGAVMLLYAPCGDMGDWHRGVVICAPPDNFDRSYARKEAYRRAVMAAKRAKSLLPVGRNPSSNVCRFLEAAADLPGNRFEVDFEYKAEFACQLTAYERHLVSKRWPDGKPQ